jgi:hypothetical protein
MRDMHGSIAHAYYYASSAHQNCVALSGGMRAQDAYYASSAHQNCVALSCHKLRHEGAGVHSQCAFCSMEGKGHGAQPKCAHSHIRGVCCERLHLMGAQRQSFCTA